MYHNGFYRNHILHDCGIFWGGRRKKVRHTLAAALVADAVALVTAVGMQGDIRNLKFFLKTYCRMAINMIK